MEALHDLELLIFSSRTAFQAHDKVTLKSHKLAQENFRTEPSFFSDPFSIIENWQSH